MTQPRVRCVSRELPSSFDRQQLPQHPGALAPTAYGLRQRIESAPAQSPFRPPYDRHDEQSNPSRPLALHNRAPDATPTRPATLSNGYITTHLFPPVGSLGFCDFSISAIIISNALDTFSL